MKFLSTKSNRRYGVPEIRFAYDDSIVSDADAQDLVRYFEEQAQAGVKFKAGESLQYGWMIDQFFEMADGTLEVREPDFLSMPIKFIDSMTRTILHANIQRYVVESFGLELGENLVFPSICESAIICDRALRDPSLLMERTAPKGADSGWFIGCWDESHDHRSSANLRRVSLYEIAYQKTSIIDFVAMPVGTMLAVDSQRRLSAYKDGVAMLPTSGSYLGMKFKPGTAQ